MAEFTLLLRRFLFCLVLFLGLVFFFVMYVCMYVCMYGACMYVCMHVCMGLTVYGTYYSIYCAYRVLNQSRIVGEVSAVFVFLF